MDAYKQRVNGAFSSTSTDRTESHLRSGRRAPPSFNQNSRVSPRRSQQKRYFGKVEDDARGFFEDDDEDEEEEQDLRDVPIAVPPPRRVRSNPVEPSPDLPEESFDETGKKRRRRNIVAFLFTPEQEKELAEWYRDNPRFYDKRCREFRRTNLKRRIIEDKAKEYVDEEGNVCSLAQLTTWMTNMRTYYGRLDNIGRSKYLPEGAFLPPDHRLTDREQWIKESFKFLSDHIVRIRSRKGVTLGIYNKRKRKGEQLDTQAGSHTGSHTDSLTESLTDSIVTDPIEEPMQVVKIEELVDTAPGTSGTGLGTSTGGATLQGWSDGKELAGAKVEVSSIQTVVPLIPSRVPLLQTGIPSIQTGITSLQTGVPALRTGDPSMQTGVSSMQTAVPSLQTRAPLMQTAPVEKMDVGTIERICARIIEKGPVQPTATPDSPHSAELNDFARTIVSSMRRIPEERWNDVKTDIMLVIRNYSKPSGATPAAPPPAASYPVGYWPPVPPAHAPPYDPSVVHGYGYPNHPGAGYYGPPTAPSSGPTPMYPPMPPHAHPPGPHQGQQFMQAPVTTAPVATISGITVSTTSVSTTSGS
ncbi:uncharacterized protein LOC135153053 [Lytechinus pictus]|uniref:uncharacterized protein LOC135153053 n=1 Tax=Lytechinus pictus TaxID=7653 RepID=UPI0030B9C54E